MGFMDKFKDAAQQAQHAAKSAGGSVASMGGMGGAADAAAKANKIAQSGIKHPAILRGMRETGNKDPLSGGVEYELEVEVKPTGGEPYSATFAQQLLGLPATLQAEDRRRGRRQRRPRRPAVDAALGLSAGPVTGTAMSFDRPATALNCSHIRGGRIEVTTAGATAWPARRGLRARLEIADRRAYRWALRGSTGFGEGYVDGLWDTDDLRRAVPDRLPQPAAARPPARPLPPAAAPGCRASAGLVPRNTRAGADRHISAHYDLGEPLFEAFLDPRLVYSCAVFEDERRRSRTRSWRSSSASCAALDLGPDDHLLEIGTGWGGLAIHAAATRGCRVTTTTISRHQHAYATERVRAEGLDDRVEVLLTDYRDLHRHLRQARVDRDDRGRRAGSTSRPSSSAARP